MAAGNDKPDMVKLLLEFGADIHAGNGRFASGPTALWTAIYLKSLESVKLLLQHGGPISHIDDDLRNLKLSDGETKRAVLSFSGAAPPAVRLQTSSNANHLIQTFRADPQNMNPPYVFIELSSEDRSSSWLHNLQIRKSDEELREHGENARELNEAEAVKEEGMDEDDPRRMMVADPKVGERDDELGADDDVMPLWRPAYVAA